MPKRVLQVVEAEFIGAKSSQTFLVHVDDERLVGGNANVKPQIELVAPDQKRLLNVALHDCVGVVV